MMKRMLAYCLMFLVSVSIMIMPIAAALPPEPDVEPEYISTCVGGDKHFMVGRGSGKLFLTQNGETTEVYRMKPVTQCTKCYLVLITENNPFSTVLPWGIYATKSEDEMISSSTGATIIETDAIFECTDLSGEYYQGFEFALVK